MKHLRFSLDDRYVSRWRAILVGWARMRRVAGRAVRVRRAQQLKLFEESAQ